MGAAGLQAARQAAEGTRADPQPRRRLPVVTARRVLPELSAGPVSGISALNLPAYQAFISITNNDASAQTVEVTLMPRTTGRQREIHRCSGQRAHAGHHVTEGRAC